MKLKLRILLSTAFVLCLMVGAYAQNIQFKGKVNNKATVEIGFNAFKKTSLNHSSPFFLRK
jgi:hypothetical protein